MSRPKRLANVSYVGRARYFLTFCTCHRIKAFNDPETAARTLEQFRRTAALEEFAILEYCVMPDHVHLLVEGKTATSDLRRFVKMAKQRSGGVHRRQSGTRLWQEGYFDRVLRDADDAPDFARYIINNPAELLDGGSKKQDPPYTAD
jgi:REP element-mobilizing transposase RayT